MNETELFSSNLVTAKYKIGQNYCTLACGWEQLKNSQKPGLIKIKKLLKLILTCFILCIVQHIRVYYFIYLF